MEKADLQRSRTRAVSELLAMLADAPGRHAGWVRRGNVRPAGHACGQRSGHGPRTRSSRGWEQQIPRYPFACAPLPVLAPRPGTAWGHPPVRSITPGNTVSPHGLEARISPAELGDR